MQLTPLPFAAENGKYEAIDNTVDEPGLGGMSEKPWDESMYDTRKGKVTDAWSDATATESTAYDDVVASEAENGAKINVYDTLSLKGSRGRHSTDDDIRGHEYELATDPYASIKPQRGAYEMPISANASVYDARHNTVYLKPNKVMHTKPVLHLDMLG